MVQKNYKAISVKNRLGNVLKKDVAAKEDVRNKLIRKKKASFVDARERLGQLARQKDAREVLEKKAEEKIPNLIGQKAQASKSVKIVHGQNGTKRLFTKKKAPFNQQHTTSPNLFTRKKALNKPVLTTNAVIPMTVKTRIQASDRPVFSKGMSGGFKLSKTISSSQRRAPIVLTKTRAEMGKKSLNLAKAKDIVRRKFSPTKRSYPIASNPNVVTIENDRQRISRPISPSRRPRTVSTRSPRYEDRNYERDSRPSQRINPQVMKSVSQMARTSRNESSVWSPHALMRRPEVLQGRRVYRQSPPRAPPVQYRRLMETSRSRRSGLLPSPPRRNSLLHRRSPLRRHSPPRRKYSPLGRRSELKAATMYVDDFEQERPRRRESHYGKENAASAKLGSRTAPKDLSRFKQAPVLKAGFRVMVTNLHPVVSPEDVDELFRTIGPLKSSRLLRQGIAEVVFVNEKDAYRAVEVYHNRQLDGQPMNVVVISDKSQDMEQTQILPAPKNYSSGFLGRNMDPAPVSSLNHVTSIHQQSRNQLEVAPDMSAIRQALFGQPSMQFIPPQLYRRK